jgi:hypothetical protein
MMRFAKYVVLGALAVAGTGCVIDSDPDPYYAPPPSRVGAVTLRWSVSGTFDPNACVSFGATEARVDLYDAFGAPIRTAFLDCRAFSARFDLNEGRYSARVELTDPGRQPRTTSAPVAPFTIVGGSNLTIDVDFPPNSFF